MIVCCGEALIDLVPEGSSGSNWNARPGGCPYTTAIGLARLGSRTAFIGRVATDFLGDLLVERLRESGVTVDSIARREEPTTLAFVKRDPSGNARYAFYSNGAADRSLLPEDLPSSLDSDAAYLVVGSISTVQEPSGSTIEGFVAREAERRLVSFDPNLRPALISDRAEYQRRFDFIAARSAIVKASDEDLAWRWPDLDAAERPKRLLALGPSLVALTRGAEGALLLTSRHRVELPAFPVEIADTIGAGDTFHAALIHRLEQTGIRKREDLEALDETMLQGLLAYAIAAASLVCTKVGGEPPWAAEVEAFLRERGS
ncbi:MAG: carbohydrate kinase [Spirochaetota bacterium]